MRSRRVSRSRGVPSTAKIHFSMNQSLDGYVDHTAFNPGPKLVRHFIEQIGGPSGSIYGRTMYEIMRYWDEESPQWSADERAFGAAWRRQPKWVVSRTLKSVGQNATLVSDDVEATGRKLNRSCVETWRSPARVSQSTWEISGSSISMASTCIRSWSGKV